MNEKREEVVSMASVLKPFRDEARGIIQSCRNQGSTGINWSALSDNFGMIPAPSNPLQEPPIVKFRSVSKQDEENHARQIGNPLAME